MRALCRNSSARISCIRTVHRHLAREGKTFSAIMDSVRAELSKNGAQLTRLSDNITFRGYER
jgi:hypothetical protein